MKNAEQIRFRWAVCQLDGLQKCLNIAALRRSLSSLPRTLDDTYGRILNEIPEEYTDYAIRMLQWLTHSLEPIHLDELAEVVATKVDGKPWYNQCARFPDPHDLLLICSSLVTIETSSRKGTKSSLPLVGLAHFSVKEYLVSERIRTQLPARFAMRYGEVNDAIGTVCVAYLL